MINDQQSFDPYAATEDSRMAESSTSSIAASDFALVVGSAVTRRRSAGGKSATSDGSAWCWAGSSELDSPKAVLYFADTMRQNAGEHYLSFFSGPTLKTRTARRRRTPPRSSRTPPRGPSRSTAS